MKYTEMIKLAKSLTDGGCIVQKSFIFSNAMYSNIMSPNKESNYCVSENNINLVGWSK